VAEQLKNVYTKNYIKSVANKIKQNYKSFNEEAFINAIFDASWQKLELKARMRHIALQLHKYIPIPYKEQLEVLKPTSQYFSSFEAMFFQDFVEVFGLEDFENSMKALEVFTVYSSSEFAIRQFILKYETQTLKQMKLWAHSSNEHLRRLSSEGSRPRLPWAVALLKFKKEPSLVFEIIEILKNDESKYVQKSVANNLNDISKDNPALVIAFIACNLGMSKSLDWICKHGARTLLKEGNKEALKLFKYETNNNIVIKEFSSDEEVIIGEALNFSFEIMSQNAIGNLRVEYAIDYLKASGKHNKKVFMLSQHEIKTNIKFLKKEHAFKEMSTRKHYKGAHYLYIIINGKEEAKKRFILK